MRSSIVTLFFLALLLSAGCLNGGGDGDADGEAPSADADVPLRLAPDTNSTLRFVFTDVGEIRLIYPTDPGTPSMDYEKGSVEPKYDLVAETLPPYLIWEEPVDRVVLEIPVKVPETGRPRTYTLGMEKWNESGVHEDGETKTRRVTVVEVE